MDTSQKPSFLTEILEGKPIPIGKIEYFRARLRSRLHQLILEEFLHHEDLTQKDLAHRIGKRADQVNRWLGAPGNWTLDTVSDLLIGMGAEVDFYVVELERKLGEDNERQIAAMIRTKPDKEDANGAVVLGHQDTVVVPTPSPSGNSAPQTESMILNVPR
jgi:plasmid maintenance system antidote protein VapI